VRGEPGGGVGGNCYGPARRFFGSPGWKEALDCGALANLELWPEIFGFSKEIITMDEFLTSSGLVALITLTFLEIVLGVDNVIFISILSNKLSGSQQARARRLGLLAALGTRILLLFSVVWIIRLTAPLFYILGRPISGRDLILVGGGLFLLAKATTEIHKRLEGEEGHSSARVRPSFAAVIIQIVVLDVVFSLDSVITAVGMAEEITIMITAVILAVAVMMFSAGPISSFVNRHPTVKVLAVSFLLLIGVSLIGEGLGLHIPKDYIYFAMAFCAFVEMINLRVRRVTAPFHLHEPYA
jgi:predicted tellurium resistance membrane protein TerC